MKKFVFAGFIIGIILSLSGCFSMLEIDDTANSLGTPPDTTIRTPEPTADLLKDSVYYISDRRVQYEEADDQYIVFFGLKNVYKEYISSAGVADISITDENNNMLFHKEIAFTEQDFTEWTNQSWDSSRYLCGLYIDRSEIKGGLSVFGTLSLQVTCADGSLFDPDKLSIYDLPEKQVEMILPDFPLELTDKAYSYTSRYEVSSLSYKSSLSYDGTASVTVEMLVKLLSKSSRKNESDYVHIAYKLIDSDGIVVDSGSMLVGPLEVGDTMRDTDYFYNLDPNETYTLKLFDYK